MLVKRIPTEVSGTEVLIWKGSDVRGASYRVNIRSRDDIAEDFEEKWFQTMDEAETYALHIEGIIRNHPLARG